MIPRSGRILAVDWGTSRIGLALSDETQLLASPLGVLTRRAGKRLPLGDFLAVVERELPVGLLIGLPVGDDGSEGPSAVAAREMGELFAARADLPHEYADESFTSATVLDLLIERGISPRSRDIDPLAASVLLQDWLDARRRNG